MTGIIYFFVTLFATFIGAISGVGGGVIIKPILDTLMLSDTSTISFLSSVAVFTMAIFASLKQFKNIQKSDFRMLGLIVTGSVVGGIAGRYLFDYCLSNFDEYLIRSIQSFTLSVLLIIVFLNSLLNIKKLNIKNSIGTLLIGLTLGVTSSFLGIGGGPINVFVFLLFFSCTMKQAAIYSLAVIVFTQCSSLTTLGLTKGFGGFDLQLLLFVIPSAILGGILGTKFNKKSKEETIHKVFVITTLALILLNIYNFFRFLSLLVF